MILLSRVRTISSRARRTDGLREKKTRRGRGGKPDHQTTACDDNARAKEQTPEILLVPRGGTMTNGPDDGPGDGTPPPTGVPDASESVTTAVARGRHSTRTRASHRRTLPYFLYVRRQRASPSALDFACFYAIFTEIIPSKTN